MNKFDQLRILNRAYDSMNTSDKSLIGSEFGDWSSLNVELKLAAFGYLMHIKKGDLDNIERHEERTYKRNLEHELLDKKIEAMKTS